MYINECKKKKYITKNKTKQKNIGIHKNKQLF